MDICYVAVVNKSIKYRCSFIVVPGNRPALLGMPNCDWVKLLTMNCQTADDTQNNDKSAR